MYMYACICVYVFVCMYVYTPWLRSKWSRSSQGKRELQVAVPGGKDTMLKIQSVGASATIGWYEMDE